MTFSLVHQLLDQLFRGSIHIFYIVPVLPYSALFTLVENFNKYLNVIEGNIHTSEGRRDGRVKKLTSVTKLLSLLSTSTTEEEEQHDYIFLVIADMVIKWNTL